MSFLNKYPYTDFHELNLDWFLAEFARVTEKVGTLEETVQQFTEFVTNYFDNLDVQQEINNKLNQMYADGSLSALIQPLFDTYTVQINGIVAQQNAGIENVTQEVADNTQRMDTLEDRMDTFTNLTVGSTTGDAELMDGRVGIDATTYANIGGAIRGQATELKDFATFNAQKMNAMLNGNKIALNFNRMMITGNQQWVKADGTVAASTAHAFIGIYDKDIEEITLPAMTTTSYPAVVVKNAGNVVYAINGSASVQTIKLLLPYDQIFFNWWSANATPEYSGVALTVRRAVDGFSGDVMKSAIDGELLKYPINKMTYVQDGYINASGSFVSNAYHRIYSIDASTIDGYRVEPDSPIGTTYCSAVLKDAGGNVRRAFTGFSTTDPQEWRWEAIPGSTLYVCWYNYKASNEYDSIYVHTEIIPFTHEKGINAMINTVKYPTSVTKPYSFSGKRVYFFGDSITWGWISGVQANPTWPQTFSALNGCNGFNLAVNAAAFCNVTGYPQIINQVTGSDRNCDVMFIAGGINDWQLERTYAEVKTAVTALCTYLRNNYTGRVIFITPINEAGWKPVRDPQTDVYKVRQAITEVALTFGYDVIQGTDIPMPTVFQDSAYIAAMSDDGLHPTQLGYDLIGKTISGIVN